MKYLLLSLLALAACGLQQVEAKSLLSRAKSDLAKDKRHGVTPSIAQTEMIERLERQKDAYKKSHHKK